MEDLKFVYSHFFSRKEHFIQNVNHIFLLFCFNGLEYLRTGNFEIKNTMPFCYLFFPGDKFEFEYNEKRENWVVSFDSSRIKCISDKQFSFSYGCENIVLPRSIKLMTGDLLHWRNKLEVLTASFASPVPYERLLSQLYVSDLLKYYIETVHKKDKNSPVAHLKKLIDAPENMRFTLEKLSEKVAYSTDYLRVLFKRDYGISPKEYRIRRIMAYAMELICKSTLMVSGIAEECGFQDLSHFSRLFKKVHNMSPSDAIKRFRYF